MFTWTKKPPPKNHTYTNHLEQNKLPYISSLLQNPDHLWPI